MRCHAGYAAAAVAILLVEILIALFVHDAVIRPHGGDVLAVVLVYLGLRAVTRLTIVPAAITAFAIALAIEIGQLFDLVDLLGLGGNRIARTVLGTGFDLYDILAYAAGALLSVAIDRPVAQRIDMRV
jgi:hypothetical protein